MKDEIEAKDEERRKKSWKKSIRKKEEGRKEL